MTWIRKLGRVFTWQWWLLYWPVELRIIKISGTPNDRMVLQGTRWLDRFYIERRGGWRHSWQRIHFSDTHFIHAGVQADPYGSYESAELALLELRAHFMTHDDMVVTEAPEASDIVDKSPPPTEPPDLSRLITKARRRHLGDGVVHVLEDAMSALNSIHRVGWMDDYVWKDTNRPQVASIIAHCAASLEALLLLVRNVETELMARRREKVPPPVKWHVSAPSSGRDDWAAPYSSACPPITPVGHVTTALPHAPLQELADSAKRGEGILSLDDTDDEPPAK